MNVDDAAIAWPPELEARFLSTGRWTGRTLEERLRTASAAVPGNAAVIDGSTRLNHAQLWQYADGTAVHLARLGLRAGDPMVLQLPNCWEFVVLTLACFRLGIRPVMALPAHRSHELTDLAEQVGAKAIAVPSVLKGFDHQAMAHQIVARSATLEHVLVAGDDLRLGSVSLRNICEPDDAPALAELGRARPEARTTALFLLSGGTTGTPKLIPRTHNDYGCAIDHAVLACRFDADTVYLATMPVGHNFSLAGPGILGALLAGGTVVLGTSPDPGVVFPLIERERVTVTPVVPAVTQRWLDFQVAGHEYDISSLQVLQVGGAHLPEQIARRVTPTLGCVLQQGYGMAEGLICITRLDDSPEVICTTQGRPICPDDELRLVSSDGRPVRPGEPGIVHTRGPYTIRGYYRAPEHNAVAFDPDGWYITGDIGRLRPDGNLVIEGRVKDVINRGGEKISAEEVEELVYRVAGVSLVAAVAMPDPHLGERVCVYAVPRDGVELSLPGIVEVMKDLGVAAHKLPERLIVTDTLPLTAVGKIDKKALRADLQQRLTQDGSEITAPASA